MDKGSVRVILESKKGIWKCQELIDLVEEYFENSLKTLYLCCALERCLKRARDSQLLIVAAIQQFEEESKSGDKCYAKTLQELKNFKSSGDPFTEELLQNFQTVYRQQKVMVEKLQIIRKKKLDKKSWRKVSISSMRFVVTVAAVLIGSVVATPPVAAALGYAAAVPIRLKGNNGIRVKEQKKVIGSMQGFTNIVINDLENTREVINSLEVDIESLFRDVDFAIEGEYVKIAIEEIKKKHDRFMKKVEELGVENHVCSQDTVKASNLVLQKIINQPII